MIQTHAFGAFADKEPSISKTDKDLKTKLTDRVRDLYRHLIYEGNRPLLLVEGAATETVLL